MGTYQKTVLHIISKIFHFSFWKYSDGAKIENNYLINDHLVLKHGIKKKDHLED